MKVIKIDKIQWAQGIEAVKKAYAAIGPAKEKDYYRFRKLGEGELPDFTFRNTRLSPKALVFPQSEEMFEYTLDQTREDCHLMKDAAKDYSGRAVIGIRPCDVKALQMVKRNFDTDDYKDPYWLNLFNATTLVGLACDAPCSTCFCTTTGSGPYDDAGMDVLLADNGNHYLATVLTSKGEALMAAAGWQETVDGGNALEEKKRAAQMRIVSTVATDRLRGQDTLDLYHADFWEDVSFACINCGTCTFVCPTCWCFDIQDEVHGKSGRRMRNWDSCMFPIFTVHTTGHNPRGTKLHRVRQRFMHKLKYFVDKYDDGIMCVGCGRCVRQCPVNIDIRRVCELMNSFGSENACAVQGS